MNNPRSSTTDCKMATTSPQPDTEFERGHGVLIPAALIFTIECVIGVVGNRVRDRSCDTLETSSNDHQRLCRDAGLLGHSQCTDTPHSNRRHFWCS